MTPVLFLLLAPVLASSADPAAIARGQAHYQGRCAACHGGDGRGGERAPEIRRRIGSYSDAELGTLLRRGLPGAGMPGYPFSDTELAELIAFLRSWPSERRAARRATVRSTTGETLEGIVRNESATSLQLETADHRLVLLRRQGESFRPVGNTVDWPGYHGDPRGTRYSRLAEIHAGNVARLAPRWIFTLPGARRLEVTPVVIDGVMYVTNANEVFALDAGEGRLIWHYRRPRTQGLIGDAAGGINRGVAVLGDRLFFVTDHAHLIALNRFTGSLLWETEMADYRQNYGATSAPLAVGDLVLSGSSGGDEGIRGFIAAFRADTGAEVWRFWTVPQPGEPGSETWIGKAIEHGCAAAWFTGTYDPELDTVYWPTGNPCPDYNGDERQGDNLYSNSVVALDPRTGALKWHFQFTPHDLHDWDATEVPVLLDAAFQGRQRKLLVQANRNGFYYILDRTDGRFLQATPFVRKLTWASGIDAQGRPILVPGTEPSAEGAVACPAVEGATNWMSPAYHPATGLLYVQTLEECNIYRKSPGVWQPGKSYYDGDTREIPGEPGQKILRAIEATTGRIVWEHPQIGPANSWGGVLATAGGLVFFGEDGGAFTAADARSGKILWRFPTGELWKASPMTYQVDGRQYVAVAAGPNILAFGLVE
jgi:alcohol dehydrogenase (cytochrome c)